MIDVKLKHTNLSVDECVEFVRHPSAGGHTIFIGRVRNTSHHKTVVRLDFEAYEPMAIKEIQKIAKSIQAQWEVYHIAIHHRLGLIGVEDIAVIIAISSAHRVNAFAACQYAIDTLKETVPIWKKEIFEDGEEWVSARP